MLNNLNTITCYACFIYLYLPTRSRKRGSAKEEKTLQGLVAECMKDNCQGLMSRPNYYDEAIYNILMKDDVSVDKIDGSYLLKCFQYGCNKIILHVFSKDPEKGRREFFLFLRDKNPLLVSHFKASEDVVLNILDVCLLKLLPT